MPDKFYLTTPIYYVNARPHIGHAYSTLVCDVIARRRRLLGEDVFFLTGTDEHGQKIERSAKAAGMPPQQFADQVSAEFKGLWDRMGLTYTDYIRTTEPRHKTGAQKLFSTLRDKGFIYKATYTGQYCVSDEAFADVAPGAPCPDCGRITETISEENYYFKLSEFQKPLLDYYEAHPEFISPEGVKNEVLSFVRGGLKDLSVSRTSFNWGIPVPGDDAHVIYVWLDALSNYMTAVGYGDPKKAAEFKKWWPADLHLVGKEITRFHCVYWPAFLMAAELPLPKRVVANGWLLFEESKMSKSRGNIVRTETILDAFGALKPDLPKHEQDLFAADVLRYFLLREIPFGQDGSFSFDALVTRYNSDLANGYGNLVSRTLKLIEQNFQNGIIVPDNPPQLKGTDTFSDGQVTLTDQPSYVSTRYLIKEIEQFIPFSEEHLWPTHKYRILLAELMLRISHIDAYISYHKPWELTKSDNPVSKQNLVEVLYTSAESIRIITALLYPVMPYATAQVWKQLGLGDIEQDAKDGKLKDLQWGGLKPETKLGSLGPIFPRADAQEIIQHMNELEQKTAKLVDTAPVQAAAPAAEAVPSEIAPTIISIDDFAKVELRVARILVAERIPKADKLLRLEVDLGYEKRQILSGIAEHYTPEELIGRRVVIVANLAPRKMRGLESNGMVVAADTADGKPVLATFLEDVPLGTRLK
jgi:methionyl-tRNA synthetase